MSMRHFSKMIQRVEIAKESSDKDFFDCLMYYGEMMLKTIVSGLTACIVNGKERYQYAQEFSLVRCDGIGTWASSLGEIVSGPTSSNLVHDIRDIKNEFSNNVKEGDWRYKAATLMNDALRLFVPDTEKIGQKTNLRRLFDDFVRLRNKTRGHGAPSTHLCTEACAMISSSLNLAEQNCSLLNDVEWAYLHQNLSGKYRVVKLSEDADKFEVLKKYPDAYSSKKYEDGVYIFSDRPRRVALFFTDVELSDCYFPNGSFEKKTFELLSYITGKTKQEDSSHYLNPADELPFSETRGLVGFEVQGDLFGNLPCRPIDYIHRELLEKEVKDLILDQRNPVITLVGRGGIGKTSTALSVLHDIAMLGVFELAIWFSARDIDLLPYGAKPVKPDVFTIDDIALEFTRLVDPDERHANGFNPKEYFRTCLSTHSGKPTIFIFDNFETLKDPVDSYQWINTNIRLPNKVIITTRFRDFKGDFPVEVKGMNEKQSEDLICSYSKKIGADKYIQEGSVEKIIEYADGHPYVIKILVGDVLRQKKVGNLKATVASKEDILEALFDRTYSNLSEAARRVFLLLSNWRSLVPDVAVEAVLLRNREESLDVSRAIDDLTNSSLVERQSIEGEQGSFLFVPLAASIFGKQKLSVSPYKLEIEQDTEILQFFGAIQQTDMRHGIRPRIISLVSKVKSLSKNNPEKLIEFRPMLEYIARRNNDTWLAMSDIYYEFHQHEEAIECIKKYIEREVNSSNKKEAWNRIAHIGKVSHNFETEVHALLEIVSQDDVDYQLVSDIANRINGLLSTRELTLDGEKKELIVNNVATIMSRRIVEATSDDCSRLAWLYLHMKQDHLAKQVCERGLSLDPQNSHCINLMRRLDS